MGAYKFYVFYIETELGLGSIFVTKNFRHLPVRLFTVMLASEAFHICWSVNVSHLIHLLWVIHSVILAHECSISLYIDFTFHQK